MLGWAFVCFAAPYHLLDLSSPTRNPTRAPCSWKHEFHQGIPQYRGCLSHQYWHIYYAASTQKYFLPLYLKNVGLLGWLSGLPMTETQVWSLS